MDWSLLIFAFNEEGSISKVIDKAIQFAYENKNGITEIIILDDGSTDNTKQIIEEYRKSHPEIKPIYHEKNKGIGMALKSVYAQATCEYVCAIPADNQFDIELLNVVSTFNDNQFFSFYRKNPYESWFRNMLHIFNKYLNRAIFGIRLNDVNWVKVYKLQQLKSISTELTSSLIESEICIKIMKKGVMPIEHYSPYLPRETGVSKGGSFLTVKKAVNDLFLLYFVIQRFKNERKDA